MQRERGGDIQQASAHSARSYNFDCPPCRQLDPQLQKYKAHTGAHKSVWRGVTVKRWIAF